MGNYRHLYLYLYQAVTNTLNYKMPVFQMLSAMQNVNAIQYWLCEFLRIGSIRKANFPIPRSVVCDFDMALLNSIVKVFGQYSNLKHYLTTCFALILTEHSIETPKCFIRLDICHYMHMASKWKFFSNLNPKVKKFYIRVMALLTKQTNFFHFVELAKSIILLSLSEEIGKDNDGNDSPSESAPVLITNHIKGIEEVSLYDKDNNTQDEDFELEITNCNIASWSSNLLEDCRKTLAETKIKCDMANPYYVPQLSQKLKTFLPYFPLYSGVMIPIFGYGQINASSSSVKSEMKDIKHILLKNKERPMRADKFVTTHLRSFAGRSLLAMSTHDSLLFAKNNESVTKNGVISNSISKTEPIIPTIGESIRPGDILNSPIMLNKSKKFKTDSNSPKNIGVEFYAEENDIISDDIIPDELNLEHNWRNKNTTQTNKRKTYLDNCPDWDISHTGKTRIGVANLQNDSLCSFLTIDKKRVVVINTCGFDNIASIIARACINEYYKNSIETSDINIMRFVKCFLKNGCSLNTYKLRAEILMGVNNFKTQIDKNNITIDCLSSIGNVAQYVFKNSPSYTEIRNCIVCSNIIMRQSVLIPINIDIIIMHGYCELSTAILECMPNNRSTCCKQRMSRNIKYGKQIFIECDAIENDIEKEHSLAEFQPKIQVGDHSFLLAGIVARYGDIGNGHYVGYSYQGSQWIEFDDLVKNTRNNTKEYQIKPHLIIYIACETNFF